MWQLGQRWDCVGYSLFVAQCVRDHRSVDGTMPRSMDLRLASFFFLLENNVSAEGDIRHTFSPRWLSPVDSSYFLGAAVFGPSLFVVFLFSILSYFLGQWKGQTHLHCHMSLVKSLATSELTRSPQRYAKCTKYV